MRAPRTKKVDERRPESWVKKATLAAMFDISDRSVERFLSKVIPADAVRGEGKGLEYHGKSIIVAWAIRHYAGTAPSVHAGNLADEMLVEGDSPALERYRNARAALSELDLAERRGVVVHVDRFREHLVRAFRLIRRAGESLQRKFGNEASDILNEHLDEGEREWRLFFENEHTGQSPTDRNTRHA